MARGRDFLSMAERQHEMWQVEVRADARKNAPGPRLDRCHCGAFAPYSVNNFWRSPGDATFFCERHCPPDVSGRGNSLDL